MNQSLHNHELIRRKPQDHNSKMKEEKISPLGFESWSPKTKSQLHFKNVESLIFFLQTILMIVLIIVSFLKLQKFTSSS